VREPGAGGLQGARQRGLSGRLPSAKRWLGLIAAGALAWPAAAPAAAPAPPEIPARAWVLLDAGDGARLAAAHSDDSYPMASTTKLMTAYLALRELPLDKRLVAPPYHPIPGESLLGLEAGERISVHDLLYGLLLPSGNDAAATLAKGAAGSTPAFVAQMNRAASRLGLRHTSYANPIGLDQPSNYSSPDDLATLALRLRRERIFRRIVDTPRTTLHAGAHPRTIVNHNDLIGRVPWMNGVKTGYTPDAGYVLVGSGTRKGVTLLSVVMGAPSIRARDGDTLALLRYGFSLYHRRTAITSGETLAHAPVANGERGLALVADRAVRATVRRGQRAYVRVVAPRSLEAPVRRGERLGHAVVTVEDELVGRVPLRARYSVRVASNSLLARADDALPGPRAVVWGLAAAVVAALGTGLLVARRRPG
jgi:D-alanyl-D-alanine carboxypeptidase (penicillin-binding protein 5/6)